MKIEDILSEWDQDAEINATEINTESLKSSKLHAKYLRMFVNEKLAYHKLASDLKQLRLMKYEFYTQGHNEETRKLGWELPPIGIIRVKADVAQYIDADKDIINLTLRLDVQKEKLEALESIIHSIKNRGYQIRNMIDYEKFIRGF